MSKNREKQRANKKKGKFELNCSRFSSRDLNPISQGNIRPQNCKTPCSYGTGRAFCFPCMAKIMEEHKELRKAA